ncbi:MAG: hypothetical protein LBR45_03905 [Bacteroidales bacterium]|nr:hypothetical protein [Bacteroidales bacterium]
MIIKLRNILVLLLWVVFLCTACIRNNYIKIPVPAVKYVVYPYGGDYELMAIGGYKIIPNEGYAGIIVYHYSDEEFLAYDLACPNDYQQGCKVEYFNGDLMLECPCCGTTFSIFDGFPRSNVDTYPSPLYKYGTSIGANRVVYIYN